ncbi:MAG: ABC transporter substrate-binding protein [Alphaproteobacteria bacterium]|nr:ABC transporter substrate-binding protein [Alphaproteobacteria bacterium]
MRYILSLIWLITMVVSIPVARAEETPDITVSVPGPRNLSYLPIDLIPRIGADTAEGVNLHILHTGGGAVAMNNMIMRNADFAVAGVPAAMSLRVSGGDVVVIAPVDNAPLFVLMVRSALMDRVKRIADLKGKVLGVNTSTKASKTTSQQLLELLLQSDGVSVDSVRIVPAGQSWVEQSSLMISGSADAVMGDEPFASRLKADGYVFFLANLAQPETLGNVAGVNFLHAALESRSDIIEREPVKVEKMVRMVKKSLAWLASHTPEEAMDALAVTDPKERTSLLLSLRNYPNAFSKDGKFSTAQLRDTDIFFHTGSGDDRRALAFGVESMINDKWAGRRP